MRVSYTYCDWATEHADVYSQVVDRGESGSFTLARQMVREEKESHSHLTKALIFLLSGMCQDPITNVLRNPSAWIKVQMKL